MGVSFIDPTYATSLSRQINTFVSRIALMCIIVEQPTPSYFGLYKTKGLALDSLPIVCNHITLGAISLLIEKRLYSCTTLLFLFSPFAFHIVSSLFFLFILGGFNKELLIMWHNLTLVLKPKIQNMHL